MPGDGISLTAEDSVVFGVFDSVDSVDSDEGPLNTAGIDGYVCRPCMLWCRLYCWQSEPLVSMEIYRVWKRFRHELIPIHSYRHRGAYTSPGPAVEYPAIG